LAVTSVFNALLGAITFATLPGHVYESVYFGGVFASLFFLQLALVSASFFLAAMTGTSRKVCANFVILIMMVTTFIPQIMLFSMLWSHGLDLPAILGTLGACFGKTPTCTTQVTTAALRENITSATFLSSINIKEPGKRRMQSVCKFKTARSSVDATLFGGGRA
jgi:hypothetical protein